MNHRRSERQATGGSANRAWTGQGVARRVALVVLFSAGAALGPLASAADDAAMPALRADPAAQPLPADVRASVHPSVHPIVSPVAEPAAVNPAPADTSAVPAARVPTAGDAAAPAVPAAADGKDPASGSASAPASAPASAATLDGRIQDVKMEVLQLNRDLLVLEEELLFPASTQVAVFVSVDVGKLFALDSVQVKLDDKEVANYLYTPLEGAALQRGGVQRLYLGNLRAGSHELVAFFTGKGPHDRDYRRGTTLHFDKSTDPKFIELQIKDSTGKLQPEFAVKVWQ